MQRRFGVLHVYSSFPKAQGDGLLQVAPCAAVCMVCVRVHLPPSSPPLTLIRLPDHPICRQMNTQVVETKVAAPRVGGYANGLSR